MADSIQVKLPDGSVKDVPKGTTALDIAKSISPRLAEVVMTEGRYHQVRRMFATQGCQVVELDRIKFGPLDLGSVPVGKWIKLQVNSLDNI